MAEAASIAGDPNMRVTPRCRFSAQPGSSMVAGAIAGSLELATWGNTNWRISAMVIDSVAAIAIAIVV